MSDNGLDKLELTFYQQIRPRLTKFESDHNTGQDSELHKFIPRFFAGATGDDAFLILEDVTKRGYQLAKCNDGLDIDLAKIMVERVRDLINFFLQVEIFGLSWLNSTRCHKHIFNIKERSTRHGVGRKSFQR